MEIGAIKPAPHHNSYMPSGFGQFTEEVGEE